MLSGLFYDHQWLSICRGIHFAPSFPTKYCVVFSSILIWHNIIRRDEACCWSIKWSDVMRIAEISNNSFFKSFSIHRKLCVLDARISLQHTTNINSTLFYHCNCIYWYYLDYYFNSCVTTYFRLGIWTVGVCKSAQLISAQFSHVIFSINTFVSNIVILLVPSIVTLLVYLLWFEIRSKYFFIKVPSGAIDEVLYKNSMLLERKFSGPPFLLWSEQSRRWHKRSLT